MRRGVLVLFLAGLAAGQGGRDGSTGVLFLSWRAQVESDAIHRAAWQALEPHSVARRRMTTFGGDERKARAYLKADKDARVVVAYDRRIALLVASELPKAAVLKVYEESGAHVHAWTDRKRFYAAVGLLLGRPPSAIAGIIEAGRERGATVAGFGGLDWVREGVPAPEGDKPLLSTSAHVKEGRAVITMRPDARSLGQRVAAQVLRHLRTGKPFTRVTVKRMRLTVDLGAAKRAGLQVPLRLLARADVVRRGP